MITRECRKGNRRVERAELIKWPSIDEQHCRAALPSSIAEQHCLAVLPSITKQRPSTGIARAHALGTMQEVKKGKSSSLSFERHRSAVTQIRNCNGKLQSDAIVQRRPELIRFFSSYTGKSFKLKRATSSAEESGRSPQTEFSQNSFDTISFRIRLCRCLYANDERCLSVGYSCSGIRSGCCVWFILVFHSGCSTGKFQLRTPPRTLRLLFGQSTHRVCLKLATTRFATRKYLIGSKWKALNGAADDQSGMRENTYGVLNAVKCSRIRLYGAAKFGGGEEPSRRKLNRTRSS